MKTEYDRRMEHVAALKEELAHRSDAAHKAANAICDQMVVVIDRHLEGGDLQKLAGDRGLLKSANASARAESEALTKLQAEYSRELARANEVFPDHFAQVNQMRAAQVPADGGRTFCIVSKGGESSPLAMPEPQPQSVDPKSTLSDIQLGRRFDR